ncbi:MAG: methylmalonyl Co-A mutase-associated GTPase MeaB [Anaerolineales bacterium]|jgi:LAO/AO transport system kinase
MGLAERVLKGDRLALARLLTKIENEEPAGLSTMAELYPKTGRAHRVGITGAPGTGKSTLVNQLALHIRRGQDPKQAPMPEASTVGIVAVDPSSPFSGGAFLGDRIRMRDLAGDPGIFIRSMATRGALGGVARATADLVDALDAAGFGMILIETVGAGQAEVEIARTAHTTIVVDAPGLGDDVQAVKAGILEIADILVVNKADLPGAENTLRALKAALALAPPQKQPAAIGSGVTDDTEEAGPPVWSVPVLPTVATSGQGIAELAQHIARHREHLGSSGEMAVRERDRVENEIRGLLRDHLEARFLQRQPDKRFEAAVKRVLARKVGPRQAVQELIDGAEA